MADKGGRPEDDEGDSWHLAGVGPSPSEGSDEERVAYAATALAKSCPRCREEMQSIGIVDFRTGGSEGKWRLLAGEWADMDEALLPLELRYCPRCREVAFRKP